MCKAGECHGAQIPPWGSDQSRKAIRVQVPSGSFNACQRREFALGDRCDRVVTGLGDRFKQAAMNSSTVKGPLRACWSVQSETVPNWERPTAAGKGQLLASGPRNPPLSLSKDGNCDGTGVPNTRPRFGPVTGPTDVTDCAKCIC
jgi:hypothetical protein